MIFYRLIYRRRILVTFGRDQKATSKRCLFCVAFGWGHICCPPL